jgi:hypothetical protein
LSSRWPYVADARCLALHLLGFSLSFRHSPLEGDANGAPHPEPSAYAKKFSGKYAHRLFKGGIGHNLPQEAPQAFAQAIIDVADI